MTQQTASAVANMPRTNIRALTRLYYQLTKPGIVYSNVMTAAAGYLFASQWRVRLPVAFGLLLGTGLIIAASCVLNNYIDRRIDSRMSRTSKRALVTREIGVRAAIAYCTLLGAAGFGVLTLTNPLTVMIGVAAVLSYVVLYGIAKRRSVHGTLIGTLPGAASLVAGYTAVTGRLDVAAALLFIVMVCWQMAHFYAISMYRRDDYARAGLPVRAVSKGFANTMLQIRAYIVLYVLATIALWTTGYANVFSVIVMAGVGGWWLYGAIQPAAPSAESAWGKRVFLRSLIVLLVFAAAVSLASLFR